MAENYSHIEYWARLILWVTYVETVLGITIFSCQTITSWRFTRRWRADYWVSALALCLALFTQFSLTYCAHYYLIFGRNNHIPDLEDSLKWGWITQLVAIWGTTLGKISIICFLIQVRGRHRSRPWLLYFIGLSNILVDIVCVTLLLTQCSPHSKLWFIAEPGVCHNTKPVEGFAYFQGAWSAVCDASLALYPVRIIWNLKIQVRTKIGLCILMGFGILAAACAAIKTSQLHALQHTEQICYTVAPLVVAAMTEQWITIFVACLPPSRPALKALIRKIRDGWGRVSRAITTPISEKSSSSGSASFYPGEKIAALVPPPPKVRLPVGIFSSAYHDKREVSNCDTGIMMKTDVTIQYDRDSDYDPHTTKVRGPSDPGMLAPAPAARVYDGTSSSLSYHRRGSSRESERTMVDDDAEAADKV